MELLPLADEYPTPNHQLTMNIIFWNNRGALKPNFQNQIRELTHNHDLAVFVVIGTRLGGERAREITDQIRELTHNHDLAVFMVMGTRLGGERAREITDRLPFDSAIHTETIKYVGRLWLLWNSNKVEVEALANTEQEIHVEVKVCTFNSTWLFSAIYTSPKSKERQVLCSNLSKVAELHNKPWIMTGDFNEPLVEGAKFGGRGVSLNISLLFKECLNRCNMIDMV